MHSIYIGRTITASDFEHHTAQPKNHNKLTFRPGMCFLAIDEAGSAHWQIASNKFLVRKAMEDAGLRVPRSAHLIPRGTTWWSRACVRLCGAESGGRVQVQLELMLLAGDVEFHSF
eukprot:1372999-Rhodomonas_salina.1